MDAVSFLLLDLFCGLSCCLLNAGLDHFILEVVDEVLGEICRISSFFV